MGATLGRIGRRVRAILRWDAAERELEAELRYHLERDAEVFVRDGLTRKDAEAAALRAFGGLARSTEDCRDARGVRLVSELHQDLRYATRMMRRNRGLSAIVVLTVAAAIAANTALFSIINGVLLTPLDFPGSERLVVIDEHRPDRPHLGVAFPDFLDWQVRQRAFESMAAWLPIGGVLTGGGEPERVFGRAVTRSFFPTLGVPFHLGRPFSADEDRPGGGRAIVLNYGLWQRRYAGDTAVVGRTVNYNGDPYTIVGVLPAGFDYYGRANLNNDVFLPLGHLADQPYMKNRESHPGRVLARLGAGVTLERAQADLAAVASGLSTEYPATNRDVSVRLLPLLDDYVGDSRLTLGILLAASGLVLAVACANIANLLLARAASRRREIGVRLALGAGRARIVRQMLAESIALATLGGLLGLVLGGWGTAWLAHAMPNILPRLTDVALDGRVIGFAAAVTIAAGIAFGMAPAFQGASIDLQHLLRDGGRSTAGSGRRLRELLVVAEIALSVVLVVGAGLLVRSFSALAAEDPGFQPNGVVTMRLRLPDGRYRDRRQVTTFLDEVLARISAIPHVDAACLTTGVPLGRSTQEAFAIGGAAGVPRERLPVALLQSVSPGYHSTFGIRLLAGRYFSSADGERAAPVALVDDELVRRHFPDRPMDDVIGREIRIVDQGEPVRRIVGVVRHVRHAGLDEPPQPEIYTPYAQIEPGWQLEIGRAIDLGIRTSLEPRVAVSAIRKEVGVLDRELPLSLVRTMSDALAQSMASRLFNLWLLCGCAATALGLTVLGVYGMVSYGVAERTREIGVRIALGARRSQVLAFVMRGGLRLVSVGVAAGLAGAVAEGRVLRTLLYGVAPDDPLTFGGVALLLVLVAASATYLPARRATRTDPTAALRDG